MANDIRRAFLGLIVGDALGVPVEFVDREKLKSSPIKDMTGYGTYNQPPGTWSDDTSLTLCTIESLIGGFDIVDMGNRFVRWLYQNHWTPHGEVFDVGGTTEAGLQRLKRGVSPANSGSTQVSANGNGSLMRILPLLFYVDAIETDQKRYEVIRQVSAITHAHLRSTLSCFYYLEFARFLCHGSTSAEAYEAANESFLLFVQKEGIEKHEVAQFNRLISGNLAMLDESEIKTDTYVIYTLEAALWCVLTTQSYPEAVLKAVNLGKDTDTTAAVTGGLAGLLYSADAIPPGWLKQIAKREQIEDLIDRFSTNFF